MTIAAGNAYGEATITLGTDAVPEPTQSLDVTLTVGTEAVSHATPGDDDAMVLAITDTDSDPTVQFTATGATYDEEGTNNGGSLIVTGTLQLSVPNENNATVQYTLDATSTAISVDDGLDNDTDGSIDEDDAEDSAVDYSLSPAHSTDILFTGGTTYDTEKSVTITMEDLSLIHI